MTNQSGSKSVIKQLLSIQGLKIECPHCEEASSIRRFRLFGLHDTEYPRSAQQFIDGKCHAATELLNDIKSRKKQLAEDRRRKPEKISTSTESTNFGQIGEQILPSFNNFPYQQQDCRGLFKPVDYLVFNKLFRTGKVDSITFVDVKTGNARLTKAQKLIKQCIESKKITHEVI